MNTTPSYNSSDIRSMSQLEHMRSLSSMYVGSGGIDSDVQLFKELVDNSADESIKSDEIYNIKIIVFTNPEHKRYQIAIIDHGRGIPCDKLEDVYTKAYTSGKYSVDAYGGNSTGMFGIGAKATVALSNTFISITNRKDGFAGLTVEKGVTKKYKVYEPLFTDKSAIGTTVFYETDHTILKQSDIFIDDERGLLKSIDLLDFLSAFKPNTKFTVYRVDNLIPDNWYKQDYQSKWKYLQKLTSKNILYQSPADANPEEYVRRKLNITGKLAWSIQMNKTVNPSDPSDELGYDICVNLVNDCKHNNGIIAAVNSNMMNNYSSSHIECLMNCIKFRLVKYINEDDDELKVFFNTKYTIPFYGHIRVFYKHAKFNGQTKHSFNDIDFDHLYTKYIERFFNTIQDYKWEELYDLIKEDLEEKFTAATNKSFKVNRSLKNVAYEIGNSYVGCRINDPSVTELFITEGNSAGGFAVQVRDPAYQAVLKLRGKPINALNSNANELKINDVFQNLIRLFGVTPRDTNLDNFNYKSVILLADADPDGYHILCLLICCIYKINPLILSSGKVVIANPPLHVLDYGDAALFLRDQKALNDVRVKLYKAFLDIHLYSTVNGNVIKVSDAAFRDLVYLVRRIGTLITDIATKLVIKPIILEQLIYCVDDLKPINCEAIKQKLQLEDCRYHEFSNSLLLVYKDMEINISLEKLVDEIRAYILPELNAVHWEKFMLLVTTLNTSLYNKTPIMYMQLYKIFSTLDECYHVYRLKGLGECSEEQLKYTCIDPKTRTYSIIRSIGDVDELFKLMGADSESRKKLVQEDIKQIMSVSLI